MENPYVLPMSEVLLEDSKVIELLINYRNEKKVINVLHSQGMSYSVATKLVRENIYSAQAILNKKRILWMLAYLFFFSASMLLILYNFQVSDWDLFQFLDPDRMSWLFVGPGLLGYFCYAMNQRLKIKQYS